MSQKFSPLILASASPRRRDLLANAGVTFEIQISQVDETPHPDESPEALVRRLALEKAQDVATRLPRDTKRWILGADTIVVIEGKVLGKPRDAEDAVNLLGQILGRTHRVLTGVALVSSPAATQDAEQAEGGVFCEVVESRVRMRNADEAEIRAYVAGGEPLDKAGAYALQGEGRKFVEHVEGSESNVIGLPLEKTLPWLRRYALVTTPPSEATQNCEDPPAAIVSAMSCPATPRAIEAQIAALRQRIAAACLRAGRKPDEVTLLAVCKKQPLASILAAAHAEQRDFAESYMQEARRKRTKLQQSSRNCESETKLRWHFTGHLQNNKAKEAVQLFDVLHTVDRISLARALDQHAAAQNKTMPIYLQVNLGNEPQKSGVAIHDLPALAQACQSFSHLHVEGLMTIPPYSDDPETSRPWFRRLRELRDELVQKFGHPLPGLSMGMSGDFEVAIEEGATIVRIGTAIFGAREQENA